MKNIDAILMEKMGNNEFFKEQMEKNFSDEKVISYLDSYIQMRSEDVIQKNIHSLLDKKIEDMVTERFKKLAPTLKINKIIASHITYINDHGYITDRVEEIVEDDLYDEIKEGLKDYLVKSVLEKLLK